MVSRAKKTVANKATFTSGAAWTCKTTSANRTIRASKTKKTVANRISETNRATIVNKAASTTGTSRKFAPLMYEPVVLADLACRLASWLAN